MIVYPRAYTLYVRNFFTEFFLMTATETISNPRHVCRTPECGEPMPLPEMWGKNCPACGYRQPTLDELKSRVPEHFPIARARAQAFEVDIPLDVVFV